MKANFLFRVLLLLVASVATQAQSDDDLALPDTNALDPLEDPIEGSGAGVIDSPLENTTEMEKHPALEEMEPDTTTIATDSDLYACPEGCTCNTELAGYIVDCSNKNLMEFPMGIDERSTELKLQNNNLSVVPKTISELKKLQLLNLSDNFITELAAGSISELPELKVLTLTNNRLLEYPQELKNGFNLLKLEEIDLGGNDIRSDLSVDNFSNFAALRKLILPTSDEDFVEVLCNKMKNTLETVCVGSCTAWANDCPDAPVHIDADMEGNLPGTLSLTPVLDTAPENDGVQEPIQKNDGNSDTALESQPSTDEPTTTESKNTIEVTTTSSEKSSADFSLRNAVVDISTIDTTENASDSEAKNVNETSDSEAEVKVGATTSKTNTGAVDKSIIGIIVAGMVVIIAGITIKKNWGSLKKRFGSGPTTSPERSGVNGTSPEEVPLQEKDKSPV